MATAKQKVIYVCTECGYESAKWNGKCPECGEWNTFSEEVREQTKPAAAGKNSYAAALVSDQDAVPIDDIDITDELRYDVGISELNRVLGGGLVKGSAVLLGGDPGIGKSTLLLQVCGKLCGKMKVLYISGEESRTQIKLRAKRLGVGGQNLLVANKTDLSAVLALVDNIKPDVVMVDSIQTISSEAISSSPGSVSQVKECALMITRQAKMAGIPVILVGHVNKDGGIAGPKVLEHIVDTVLHFEGDRNYAYRVLRAEKNRFGSTNEIGLFEMRSGGLVDVENPSQALLSERPHGVSGNCVCCTMEGSRPILAEVQALVTKTGFGQLRRTSTGFDFNRTALIIAVIEKRIGYFLGGMDTYINVVGGLRLDEPACDLPVALAVLSGLTDTVISDRLIAFGEIGLAGELRSVSNVEARVHEAIRQGFDCCILPEQCVRVLPENLKKRIRLFGVKNLYEAFAVVRGDVQAEQ
ncbi:MAG: DNA repair protein RadA [Oscillospiraceae bacterium]|nr:DNA repair protein RadA [Oscillospiraceae bacterium]